MKITYKRIMNSLVEHMDLDAPPRPIEELIVEVCLRDGLCLTEIEAWEIAGRQAKAVLIYLSNQHNQAMQEGRPVSFSFNSSSSYMLQGATFIEPNDSEDLRRAKNSRANLRTFIELLKDLAPVQFEALCAGILALLGVEQPYLTR